MTRHAKLLTLLALVPLCACTTVKGGPVTTDSTTTRGYHGLQERGFVYHLPAPILIATPRADGTVQVSLTTIPDPSKRYFVRATSFWKPHRFAFVPAGGLLGGVAVGAPQTPLAEAFVEASGDPDSESRWTARVPRADGSGPAPAVFQVIWTPGDDVQPARLELRPLPVTTPDRESTSLNTQ